MSLRGVKQLKELVIRYSDYDGSSRGIREWMSNNLLNFAKNNAALQIKTELKRAKHPLLIGQYANGNTKTVCIKNLDVATIESQVAHLRNQIGRRVSLTTIEWVFINFTFPILIISTFLSYLSHTSFSISISYRWDQLDTRSQWWVGVHLVYKASGMREWI